VPQLRPEGQFLRRFLVFDVFQSRLQIAHANSF
jgi:hypothetical protein